MITDNRSSLSSIKCIQINALALLSYCSSGIIQYCELGYNITQYIPYVFLVFVSCSFIFYEWLPIAFLTSYLIVGMYFISHTNLVKCTCS